MVPVSQVLLKRYERFAQLAACLVILGSLLVVAGWAANIPVLMDFWPDLGLPPDLAKISGSASLTADEAARLASYRVGRVSASAGITLFFLSSALLTMSLAKRNRFLTIVSQVICGLMFACASFAAYLVLSKEDFDPVVLLEGPDPAALGVTFPTPMSLEVAVTLSLLALAVATLPLMRGKTVTLSQALAMVSFVIPSLILLGAATRITQLCNFNGCVQMSAGFALLSVILISAVFFANPAVGLAAPFSGNTTGYAMLRRASLFICLLPLLLMARTVLTSPPLLLQEGASWVIFVFALSCVLGAIVASAVKRLNSVENELTGRIEFMKDELERSATSSGLQPVVGLVENSSAVNFKPRYKRVCLTCTNEYDDSTERCPLDSTPLSRILDESLIGQVFMDKYEIVSRLGAGGMSTVYRARHKFFEKDVAIKVLKGNTAESRDGLLRFQREARATSAINHPGIVGVSDFGLSPDGRAYLVMDYLEGESLSAYIDKNGRLSLSCLIDLTSQLCDALMVAHQAGIVHRDLKPSNIMLVRDEQGRLAAKIVDFGLAKILEEEGSPSLKITQTGECFGSPLYMSPEQCMGKKVDHRCDIYALGCILFECLTGTPPIIGNTAAETIAKHVKERPAPFPEALDIPKEVKLIIYKALHKEAMWRPQTVMEIKDALAGSLRRS